MAKICCPCGVCIPDISDHQSFKGYILSDKQLFPFYDFADEMIESSHADKEELCMTFPVFVPEGHDDTRVLDFSEGKRSGIVKRKPMAR